MLEVLVTFMAGVCVGSVAMAWIIEGRNSSSNVDPCAHKTRMTLHSENRQLCYDCGESLGMDVSYYPRHQR